MCSPAPADNCLAVVTQKDSVTAEGDSQNSKDHMLGEDNFPVDHSMADGGKGESSPTTELTPHSPRRMLKNLLVICFGFMLLFTAYCAIQNLQTSLNSEAGVGPGSVAIIYGVMIGTCLFTPSIVISRVGCKWTIPVSMAMYSLFMGANLHATWWLMAPTAALVGLAAPPLWSAKCSYVTQIGVWTARVTKQSSDAVINRFFGIFFMIFQSAFTLGNLLSSIIIRPDSLDPTSLATNVSHCGASYCPWINRTGMALPMPEKSQVYMLCGIFIGLALLAVLFVSIFLDPITVTHDATHQKLKDLSRNKNHKTSGTESKEKMVEPTPESIWTVDGEMHPKVDISTPSEKKQNGGLSSRGVISKSLIMEAVKHLLRSREQQLLVPLTMYSGFQQAFLWGDFTESFIACSLGIWNIGYILACYGAADSICSFLFGRLVRNVGHIPFFILAAVIHSSAMIVMLLWQPVKNSVYVYYALAAAWGMGDAVIQTQINAFYGYLFAANSTPAFANYRFWESIGIIITFAYNDSICTNVKLYICLGMLVLGMMGYGMVEMRQRARPKDKH